MMFTTEIRQKVQPLLPQNSLASAENVEFSPVFLENCFSYKHESLKNGEKTWQFMAVNPKTGEQTPLFDHAALCAALSCDSEKPEITPLTLKDDVFTFLYNDSTYSWASNTLTLICGKPEIAKAYSPDMKQAIFVENGNLFHEKDGKSPVQLTFDGEEYFGYGIRNQGDNGFISDKLAGKPSKPAVLWSPDNRHFLTYKLDMRQVSQHYLVQNAPPAGGRPIQYSYKYALPGEEHIPLFTPWLGDCETGKLIAVDHDPMPLLFFDVPFLVRTHLGWSDDGKTPMFCHMHRNHKQADYFKIDMETGRCTLLFCDKSDTFLFFDMVDFRADSSVFHYSDQENAFFALSEASGFSQIIRADFHGIRPITSGNFVVNKIYFMDKTHIYFAACGKEPGTMPLHNYTYRVPINGGEMQVLARRRGNHQAFFSPNGDYFITSVSTCDQPQTAVLCALDGTEICEIVEGNCDNLLSHGLTFPIPFCEKGADGVTDIFGIIVMPSGFDGEKKYPVLDYYYGGSQIFNTPQTFVDYLNCGFLPAFSAANIVGIVIDGMGTPGRGKAFHDACYRNMGGCAGIDDHEAVIKSLCNKFTFMDIDRVGVWGHSGGGFAAYQCMVKKPELYKCAVSSGGNHLQELYIWDWAERFMAGSENISSQSAEKLAENLQGKLLLIHGELDDNVHPSNTMRIIQSLIAADKDFDMLIMPNKHHRLSDDPYFQHKVIKFLVENL